MILCTFKCVKSICTQLVVVFNVYSVTVTFNLYIFQCLLMTEQRCKDSKQRVCQTMVPNPIYDGDGDGDGPVYDSVRPQYETLVAVAPARFTETHQASSVTELSHNNDADVVRYVDPPIQLPQFRSQSFAHTIADIDGGSASRSYSVSLPPPRYTILIYTSGYRTHYGIFLSVNTCTWDSMECLDNSFLGSPILAG